MAYCKYFLAGIGLIKFETQTAKKMQQVLLASIAEELFQQKKDVAARLERFNSWKENNPIATEAAEAYLKQQQNVLAEIDENLKKTNDTAVQEGFSLNDNLDLSEDFIQEFASKFRHIGHLASILVDAPAVIKEAQTSLFAAILSQLPAIEQEEQFNSLSFAQINDLVQQGIRLYDNTTDANLKAQSRRLVQLAIFTLIDHEVQSFNANDSDDGLTQYQEFLRGLKSKIVPVESSTILDNFSDFHSTKGQNVLGLLQNVENELRLNLDGLTKQSLDTIKLKKSLLQVLRFGHEDRRAYIERVKNNLARDLFWGRTVRDNLVFTQSAVANTLYLNIIAKHNVFMHLNETLPPFHGIKYEDWDLAELLNGLQKDIKVFFGDNVPEKEMTSQEKFLELLVQERLKKPSVTIENDTFIVKFRGFFNNLSSTESSTETGKIVKKILKYRLYGRNMDKIFIKEFKRGAPGQFRSHVIKGSSLADIENQLKNPPSSSYISKEEREIYLQQLNEVKLLAYHPAFKPIEYHANEDKRARYEKHAKAQENKKTKVINYLNDAAKGLTREDIKARILNSDMSIDEKNKETALLADLTISIQDLGLDSQESLLLHKLMEIAVVDYEEFEVLFHEKGRREDFIRLYPVLQNAISLTRDKNFHGALIQPNLQTAVDDFYELLEDFKVVDTKDPTLKNLLIKTNSLSQSAEVRSKKLQKLMKVFEMDDINKINELTTLFYEEYNELRNPLKLSTQNLNRMNTDFLQIFYQLVQLEARNRAGLSFLPEEIEQGYFDILEQIASELKLNTWDDVQFKIPRGQVNSISVTHQGEEKTIQLRAQILVPYSLTKTPKGKFELSLGGSRGILAAYNELDEVYAGDNKKKGRVWSQSLLGGFGTYGSVKIVIDFATGHHQVIKKGVVPSGNTSTFSSTAIANPFYRPITARDDTKPRIEHDVLKFLQKDDAVEFWLSKDKKRPKGRLFNVEYPTQYRILSPLAKGESLADAANKVLINYSKGSLAYHNPLHRQIANFSIKERIILSQDILEEAKKFAEAGFAHNDIKPENFHFRKNTDGHYKIQFIDWATAGFVKDYSGNNENSSITTIFKELFASEPKDISDSLCSDEEGRFVQKIDQKIIFGINPRLQILHGSRHGTLAYINPKVLDGKKNLTENKTDPALDTQLVKNEPTLDNWALTAMIFGICQKKAYFNLVQGRTLKDYEVPNVIEADEVNNQLVIVDQEKFKEFFACGDNEQVMFIPGSNREGEPLHLYRFLQDLATKLTNSEEEKALAETLKRILGTAYNAIANGQGLDKNELQDLLKEIEEVINRNEQINNPQYQQNVLKTDLLKAILEKYKNKDATADELLIPNKDVKELTAICTYPRDEAQVTAAIRILNQAFSEKEQVREKFLLEPGEDLFKECIKTGQTRILVSLLQKITEGHEEFPEIVKKQGLLTFAAEQNQREVVEALIEALKRTGQNQEQILTLLMDRNVEKPMPHLKWATHCFHAAVRNDNRPLLTTLLQQIPANSDQQELILSLLHLSASLGNSCIFRKIIDEYNKINNTKIDVEKIVHYTHDPKNTSPYQLLILDRETMNAIDWDYLSSHPEVAKDFLLPKEAANSALLMAAETANWTGVEKLLALSVNLAQEDRVKFYTAINHEGKNIVNFLIEKANFAKLIYILDKIKLDCGDQASFVLMKLLSNPKPVNPLHDFLNLQLTDRYSLLTKIMNLVSPSISATPKPTEQQQIWRVASLLSHSDWLLKEAEKEENHENLTQLLHNDRLQLGFKQILFTTLLTKAKTAPAKTYFNKLAQSIKNDLSSDDEELAQLVLPQINNEIARQRNDIEDFVAILATKNQELKDEIEDKGVRITQLSGTLEQKAEEFKQSEQRIEHLNNILVTNAQQQEELREELHQLKERNLIAEENWQNKFKQLSDDLAQAESSRAKTIGQLEKETQAQQALNESLDHLKAKILQLTNDNQFLQDKLTSTEQEKNELQEELVNINQKSTQLESNLYKLSNDYNTQYQEHQELQKTHNTLKDNHLNLNTSVEENNKQLESQKNELMKLQETQSENTNLKSTLDQLKQSLSDREKRQTQLENVLNTNSEKLNNQEKQIISLQNSLSTEQKSNASLLQMNQQLEQTINKVNSEILKIEGEFKSLKDIYQETNKQNQEQKNELLNLQETKSENANLKSKLKQLRQSFSDEKTTQTQLENDLNTKQEKLIDQEKQNTELRNLLFTEKQNNASLLQNNKQLEQNITILSSKITKREEEFKNLEDTYKKNIVQLVSSLEQADDRNSQYKNENEQIEQKNIVLIKELQFEKQRNQDLENSLTATKNQSLELERQSQENEQKHSQELAPLQEKLAERNLQYQEVFAKNQDLEAKEQTLTKQLSEMEKTQTRLRQEISQKDNEMQQIKEHEQEERRAHKSEIDKLKEVHSENLVTKGKEYENITQQLEQIRAELEATKTEKETINKQHLLAIAAMENLQQELQEENESLRKMQSVQLQPTQDTETSTDDESVGNTSRGQDLSRTPSLSSLFTLPEDLSSEPLLEQRDNSLSHGDSEESNEDLTDLDSVHSFANAQTPSPKVEPDVFASKTKFSQEQLVPDPHSKPSFSFELEDGEEVDFSSDTQSFANTDKAKQSQSTIEDLTDEELVPHSAKKTSSSTNSAKDIDELVKTKSTSSSPDDEFSSHSSSSEEDSDSNTSTASLSSSSEDELLAQQYQQRLQQSPKMTKTEPTAAEITKLTLLKQYIGFSKNLDFLESLPKATTAQDFAPNPLGLSYEEIAHPEVVKELADSAQRRLHELANNQEYKKELYEDNTTCHQTINTSQGELSNYKRYVQSIAPINQEIEEELKYLGHKSPIYWFNPAFQEAAKRNAAQMFDRYYRLAESCRALVFKLVTTKDEIEDQIKSLPKAVQIQQLPTNTQTALTAHLHSLQRELAEVEDALRLHLPLQEKLNGNSQAQHPLLKQGILKTLQQALNNKHEIELLGFNIEVKDHPSPEKAAEDVAKRWQNCGQRPLNAANNSPVSVTVHKEKQELYAILNPLEPGHVRQFVVNGNGSFTTESLHTNTNERYTKLTVDMFPQFIDENDPKAIEECVKFSIAFASQTLAESAEVPSAKKPLQLDGMDVRVMRYITTALLLLGRELPHCRFDHNALYVIGANYHPSQELNHALGRTWGFHKDSFYDRYFKNQPFVKYWMQGIKEISQQKYGYQELRQYTASVIANANRKLDQNTQVQTYKNDLRKLRGEEEEQPSRTLGSSHK